MVSATRVLYRFSPAVSSIRGHRAVSVGDDVLCRRAVSGAERSSFPQNFPLVEAWIVSRMVTGGFVGASCCLSGTRCMGCGAREHREALAASVHTLPVRGWCRENCYPLAPLLRQATPAKQASATLAAMRRAASATACRCSSALGSPRR